MLNRNFSLHSQHIPAFKFLVPVRFPNRPLFCSPILDMMRLSTSLICRLNDPVLLLSSCAVRSFSACSSNLDAQRETIPAGGVQKGKDLQTVRGEKSMKRRRKCRQRQPLFFRCSCASCSRCALLFTSSAKPRAITGFNSLSHFPAFLSVQLLLCL